MEKNYEVNINAQERRVEEIRSLYKEMLLDSTTDVRRRELVDEFMKCRKSDGSFSTIDDYHIDSDCVVYFALIPTYCASAALVAAELKGIGTAKTNEALLGGLKFAATMRGLIGHGFDATHDLLEAIDIYKDAGIYEWLKKNPGKAPEFEMTIRKRILEMKEALAENRVFSDWDRNFSEEFSTEVEDYERAMFDYVWYVSYGSNLSRERFMNYINRCTDKSEPIEDCARTFDFTMYFADNSYPDALRSRISFMGRFLTSSYFAKTASFVSERIQSNRRITVSGRITSPYSCGLYTPVSLSAIAQMRSAF